MENARASLPRSLRGVLGVVPQPSKHTVSYPSRTDSSEARLSILQGPLLAARRALKAGCLLNSALWLVRSRSWTSSSRSRTLPRNTPALFRAVGGVAEAPRWAPLRRIRSTTSPHNLVAWVSRVSGNFLREQTDRGLSVRSSGWGQILRQRGRSFRIRPSISARASRRRCPITACPTSSHSGAIPETSKSGPRFVPPNPK